MGTGRKRVRSNKPSDGKETFYERKFPNKTDLEAAAVTLIRNNVWFDFYWRDSEDAEKTGYYLSVFSKDKNTLIYVDIGREEMLEHICSEEEMALNGQYGTDLHHYIREKNRELYDLKDDGELFEEFIAIKEDQS